MRNNTILIFLILSCCLGVCYGQLHLPSAFSDNMVLQRETNVKFWGWAVVGSTVRIVPSWTTDTTTVRANGYSKFEADLQTPKAGGPYSITVINGRYKQTIQNVLIGEVWLASGQSNMEWSSLKGLKEMIDELPNANNDQIRLLHVDRYGAEYPQEDIPNQWKVCNPESADGFSAIGYFYAKKLQQQLGVPIGIISSNLGGTQAELWLADSLVNNDPVLSKTMKSVKPTSYRPHKAGALWNAMVHPLAGFGIGGFLWYQGESNKNDHSSYNTLMTRLVNSWRTAWGSELPFYYVQIAPYDYKSKQEEQCGALLREQQVGLLKLNKTGMVVVTDLVDNINDIHPKQKKEVASRLADIALADVYDEKLNDYKSPVYKSHQVKGDKIIIDFYFLDKGLIIKDGPAVLDLFIADERKEFKPAQCKIEGNQLIVFNKSIKKPVAVRFAFTDVSMSNLFNKNGLPVSPFRTDDWNL